MEKIARTNSGHLLVEMTEDEWTQIHDAFFSNELWEKRRTEWDNSPAHKLLLTINSSAIEYPVCKFFLHNGYHGTIDELWKVARNERPFKNIELIGKIKRKIILSALENMKTHD